VGCDNDDNDDGDVYGDGSPMDAHNTEQPAMSLPARHKAYIIYYSITLKLSAPLVTHMSTQTCIQDGMDGAGNQLQ
jgi:hypothetical protein